MIKSICTNQRVILACLLLTLVVVVARVLLPVNTGFNWVAQTGYWFMLALTALFGRAVWPLIRDYDWGLKCGRFEVGVMILIVAVVTIWTVHDRPGYKILADELMLSSTAMGMHFEREAVSPTRATDVQGSFQILSSSLDKRPLFYPFLLATVHDLTGYRAANAFYLNMGLAVVFLALLYFLGWSMTGQKWAGVAGVLLFAGFPLMAQQATGGGFELLNLLLLTVFLLLIAGYLRAPDARRLEALILGTLLLASTRYESAFFLVPAVAAALIGWVRSGQVFLSWPTLLSPLFLVPLLLHNRVFADNAAFWQMSEHLEATAPFGLSYLPVNLGHALAYFFDFTGYLTNSPLLAAIGLLSLPVVILYVVSLLKKPSELSSLDTAWLVGLFSLSAITLVYMLYFWGKFDDPIISRLSLPVHLFMMLAIFFVGARWWRQERGWQGLAIVSVIGLFFHGLPVMARQAYTTNYGPGMEMRARAEFLASLPDRNVLFIDRDSFFWILHKIPATPVAQAVLRREGIAFHLRTHGFQNIFVYQQVLVDFETGIPEVVPEDQVPGYELEVVYERRVRPLQFVRISKVTAINDQGTRVTPPVGFITPAPFQPTQEMLDRGRKEYLENWIRQLP